MQKSDFDQLMAKRKALKTQMMELSKNLTDIELLLLDAVCHYAEKNDAGKFVCGILTAPQKDLMRSSKGTFCPGFVCRDFQFEAN